MSGSGWTAVLRRGRSLFGQLTLLSAAAAVGACVVVRAPNLRRGIQTTATGRASYPLLPTWSESDEATLQQLQLAKAQGDAEGAALDELRHGGAVASGEMPAGEYDVTWILLPAQGWYAPGTAGALEWHRPAAGSANLSVVVRDAADGRTVPGLGVQIDYLDAAGRSLRRDSLPFAWYEDLNRYGDDVVLPAGVRALRVTLAPPTYDRHDPVNGDRYADTVMAEFGDVRLAGNVPAQNGTDAPRTVHALARAQGAALTNALYLMLHGVAVFGAEQRSDDYLVAFADEFAEPHWTPHGDALRYSIEDEASNANNAHVEVAVRDLRTGRFLPGLHVHVTVTSAHGKEAGSSAVPLMWHPWTHHYGMNWRVPRAGDEYRVRVHADVPAWRRFVSEGSAPFAHPIDVEFTDVRFRTGQK
jgi:hypothetical protein